jgi:hypothetical protein
MCLLYELSAGFSISIREVFGYFLLTLPSGKEVKPWQGILPTILIEFDLER